MTKEMKKISWRNLWDFLKKSYELLTVTVIMVSISCSTMLGTYFVKTWANEIDKKMVANAALYIDYVDRDASRAAKDMKIIFSEQASPSEVLEALRDIKSIDDGFYLDYYTSKNLNIIQIINNGEEIPQAFIEKSFYYYSDYLSILNWAMIVYIVLLTTSPLIVNLFKLMIERKKAKTV